jgi:hypothetical protein
MKLFRSLQNSRKILPSDTSDDVSYDNESHIRTKTQPTNPIKINIPQTGKNISENNELLTQVEKDIKEIQTNWDETVKQSGNNDNVTRLKELQVEKDRLKKIIQKHEDTLRGFGGKSKQKRKTKRTNRKRKTNKKSKRAARDKTSKNLL